MEYLSQASSAQGFRAWISHWILLYASPLQYTFQDPILPGLLPFAVLIGPFLWKGPYESKGWFDVGLEMSVKRSVYSSFAVIQL